MKRILLLLIVAFSVFSCSQDDSQLRTVTPVNGVFVIQANEELSLITVRINDSEGQTIQNYDFQNEQEVMFNVDAGEEIIIYVVDEGMFEYNYKLLDSNDSIVFEGFEQGEFNDTFVRALQ